jgi:hypothetical protein
MHRTVGSSGSIFHLGNLGGSIFDRNKQTPTTTTTTTTTRPPTRPGTSNGSSTTYSESTHSSTASKSSGFSRKTSFSSPKQDASNRARSNSIGVANSPEKRYERKQEGKIERVPLPPLSVPATRSDTGAQAKAGGKVANGADFTVQSPVSATDSYTSTTPFQTMLARPGTGYQTGAVSTNSVNAPVYSSTSMQPASPTLETITFQHIQETSSKRISTLDYLRKAYG